MRYVSVSLATSHRVHEKLLDYIFGHRCCILQHIYITGDSKSAGCRKNSENYLFIEFSVVGLLQDRKVRIDFRFDDRRLGNETTGGGGGGFRLSWLPFRNVNSRDVVYVGRACKQVSSIT